MYEPTQMKSHTDVPDVTSASQGWRTSRFTTGHTQVCITIYDELKKWSDMGVPSTVL